MVVLTHKKGIIEPVINISDIAKGFYKVDGFIERFEGSSRFSVPNFSGQGVR